MHDRGDRSSASLDSPKCGQFQMGFEFEKSRVTASILERAARRVLLQLPDGLKRYGQEIAEEIESETGATVYLSADPCYGACDLPLEEAERLGVDLIIHYGHTPFTTENLPGVIYVPVKDDADPSEAVRSALPLLVKYSKVGLAANIQHVGALKKVEEILRRSGIEVEIGHPGGHAQYDGQITGCDYTAAKVIEQSVEAYLYVGGGLFHPLGLALTVDLPVIAVDPHSGEVRDVTALGQRLRKQRRAALGRLIQASRVGVIIGTKTGQMNREAAESLRDALHLRGKKVTLLTLREVSPEALDNLPEIEAFVNTACPRVGVDDADRYSRPIVSSAEVLEAFKSGWEVPPCSSSVRSSKHSSPK